MFYLKYRPQTLDEIDNAKPRETLKGILDSGNLPHAFLFVGQKGTGKTSSARILAKAVNCLANKFAGKGDDINPCNKCANCLAIASGTSPDVMEMDAASNRGIAEVKELIRDAAFSPMAGRYRVFIIDEAHMITPDAFNAFLKTLEEPPNTVIFVFATTNENKVPVTIISRCLRLNFGKAKKSEIIRMLERIAVSEKLKPESRTLEIVADSADSSFRDASRILEELVMVNKLLPDDAQAYLGIRSRENLLNVLSGKPLKDALSWVKDFDANAGNFRILIEQLIGELHNQLLAKSGLEVETETKLDFTLTQITRLMKLFNDAYAQMRITPIESLPLEIAIVEFYNITKDKN